MTVKMKVLCSIETLLFINLHGVISQRTLSIHYIYISVNLKEFLVDGIVRVKSASILQPWIFQYCKEIICFASFCTSVANRICSYCSQVISIMAHFPPLMLWEVLEDHKKVKAPLVLVRVLEVMVWMEKSKRSLPRHMWYVECKY